MILPLLFGCIVGQANGGSTAKESGTLREVDCVARSGGYFEVDAKIGPVVIWTGTEGQAWHLQPFDDEGDEVLVSDDGAMLVYTDDPDCRAWAL